MSDGGERINGWLPTLAAIYAALTLAGAVRGFAPTWPPIRVVTFALFVALFALYAVATRSGRQTRMGKYLICGFLCPAAIAAFTVVALSIPLLLTMLILLEPLFSAFAVGVEITGDPDMPIWASILLWWLPIPLAIVAVVAVRDRIFAAAGSRR